MNEHYRKGGKHLYDPAEMETFSNKHAPGLFAQLYKSILNDDKEKPSKKHMEMQKQELCHCYTISVAWQPGIYFNSKGPVYKKHQCFSKILIYFGSSYFT